MQHQQQQQIQGAASYPDGKVICRRSVHVAGDSVVCPPQPWAVDVRETAGRRSHDYQTTFPAERRLANSSCARRFPCDARRPVNVGGVHPASPATSRDAHTTSTRPTRRLTANVRPFPRSQSAGHRHHTCHILHTGHRHHRCRILHTTRDTTGATYSTLPETPQVPHTPQMPSVGHTSHRHHTITHTRGTTPPQ